MNAVFFLLGDSRASEFYVPTFRNILSSILIGGVNKKNNWEETANLIPFVLLVHTTYEDGTDSVFRNVCI